MNLARTAGAAYVITIVAGSWALFVGGTSGAAANTVAGLSYVVVTLLFYWLFRPVRAGVSAVAAVVGILGCVLPLLPMAGVTAAPSNPLPVFGVYCLLIAWLVHRSTLPRPLGVLLAVGGLGWLTFVSPALTRALTPFSFAPGIVGETALTLYLLVVGPIVGARPDGAAHPAPGRRP